VRFNTLECDFCEKKNQIITDFSLPFLYHFPSEILNFQEISE